MFLAPASRTRLLHDILDAAAEAAPDAPALTAAGRTATYGEVAAASRRAAEVLTSLGVTRGSRVVVSAGDAFAVTAVVYGCSRAGAVFSVLHEQVRGAPLDHVLDDCEPALMVCDDPGAEETAARHSVPFLAVGKLLDALADPAPDPAAAPAPGVPAALSVDPACLIYTSGTTSLPKAVVSTHEQMLFAAAAIQSRLSYRADDVVYSPLPLSFDYGLYQLFLSALGGAHLRLGSVAESGPPLARALQESGATVLASVPSVSDRLAWLLGRSKRKPERLRLRLLTNTGAALSDSTMAALRGALPALRVQVMYGLTECKRTAIMPPDGDLERPGSCGLPLPGTEVFVIDDDGRRLGAGELGQFVVRGPNVMAGYWRRPELTAERFHRRDGLFPELRTGDYGWLDEDGYLYFSGRRDDLYKERGFRVSATEVEAAAHRVEGVTSAGVLPPDGERPALLAVVGDIDGQEVLDRMRGLIEDFKIPRRCLVLEELPVNGNGKTDRRRLASLLQAAPATAGSPTEEGK